MDRSLWEKPATHQLIQTLAAITSRHDMQRFLCDVLTEKEITEIAARLRAAVMLHNGASYQEVINATKLSSRTVARISSWLQHGAGGYTVAFGVLDREPHRPPATQ